MLANCPAREHALDLRRIPEQLLQPLDRLDLDRRGRGPPRHSPMFGLIADVTKSPTTPTGFGDEVM